MCSAEPRADEYLPMTPVAENEWNGPAYSPDTGMLNLGAVDWCTTLTRVPGKLDPKIAMDPVTSAKGRITAVNGVTGRVAWQSLVVSPVIAAVTATAGGVVFAGDVAGTFYVLNARTGDIASLTLTAKALAPCLPALGRIK